ncbi:hypothetical protein HS9_00224 [Bacillus velezensis]|nr:hypothetical protein HS9_00224 [Bacillus velezensis]
MQAEAIHRNLFFMLITMTGILASKAFEKLIRKIVIEVKKELNQNQ